ncbi:cytochrome P450 [Lophiotrema nucula]|uniref:Cytochrome P450 n=1 Tax=Lophiotrema nucula TaxID=690887 RepID=A0A6A5Z0M4_9PLEO|nr:cytochrome P450 [Lophiotrema nucula]
MTFSIVASTVATALVSAVVYFVSITYQHRAKINRLRRQGMPMPPWSWTFGHLRTLQKYTDKLPPNANVVLANWDLMNDFPESEVLLLDTWPVYPPLLLVSSPEIATQISTKYNLPKMVMHSKMMKPITGGPNLLTMDGDEWKTWRSLFNPGFSTQAIMDQVPYIVDCVSTFCQKLKEKVDKDIVILDDLTSRLTFEIITKVTLDARLEYQATEYDVIADAFGYITRWHSFWDPRILLNPLRPFIQWYYGHVLDTEIRRHLQKRFAESRRRGSDDHPRETTKAKSVISLALEGYASADPDAVTDKSELDDTFARYACYQTRLFLFAGNDTTSSSIAYVYHLLSQNLNALAKVREEHDTVFGSDPTAAAKLIREKPALLNQCRYTMAVVKETLRLYPPAGAMRAEKAGVVLTDHKNASFPVDDISATICHHPVHMNPRVWSRPLEFLPERFLVEPSHELYPDSAAFRPFEQGPRNCIGQSLVYTEMRVVLVMTARTFNIKPAYDEWDALQMKNESALKKVGRTIGLVREGPRTYHGDRAYQSDKAGTHPVDGYPCRIYLTSSAS